MNNTRHLKLIFILPFLYFFIINSINAQQSVARLWNEEVLDAIRKDFARPTVHARNLFHTSIAMYDIWATYEGNADTYFLGKTNDDFYCGFDKVPPTDNIEEAKKEAISFAVYRLILQRFKNSPLAGSIIFEAGEVMRELGYNINITSTNYYCGAAEFGNYVADCLIRYGLQDGSNEINDYGNLSYEPVNEAMNMRFDGNALITDFNRWQPLRFPGGTFVGQGGNPIPDEVPPFLSPEWGQVSPFALQSSDLTIHERNGFDYWVYHDPGPPPQLDLENTGGLSEEYKWGFSLVSAWSSHLDPCDEVIWDISPASIGNIDITDFPTTIEGLHDFYNFEEGGDIGKGHPINPTTNEPYEPQMIKRGDYTRVLAEFWADGPDSETPPGHWYTIFNYVSDHPDLVKKIGGEGAIVNDLEWDVKGYFALGGALHDAAVAAWGIKGWYDYVRPVSAIRGMNELGQSSDPTLEHFHPGGLPLIPNFIELILPGDPLYTGFGILNNIKIKAWRGPDYIANPIIDTAKVDWIPAESWWPYQRPNFVSPPFAGYISGHSTFSRAAAEVLTAYTGDPFFPGGMGEFFCKKNYFLVFEQGPTTDLTLQWATYRDASDQCSLSRIWGGIHPPADDIPGRLIGEKIGKDAYTLAEKHFNKTPEIDPSIDISFYPNPTDCAVRIYVEYEGLMTIKVFDAKGQFRNEEQLIVENNRTIFEFNKEVSGVYLLVGYDENGKRMFTKKVVLD